VQDWGGYSKKGANTMNYRKPEATVLGQAIRVIEQNRSQKPPLSAVDSITGVKNANPAYDLDD
jgi:hypothetical protein